MVVINEASVDAGMIWFVFREDLSIIYFEYMFIFYFII